MRPDSNGCGLATRFAHSWKQRGTSGSWNGTRAYEPVRRVRIRFGHAGLDKRVHAAMPPAERLAGLGYAQDGGVCFGDGADWLRWV